jgi:uncharacterized protein
MRQREKIQISAPDGQALRGIFSFTEGEKKPPAVIFAHGFGSTHDGEKAIALEAECERRGWAFAACDFRGHGESDGTMLELRGSRLIADLDKIVGEVESRNVGPIFLFGSSMGGWTAAWLAAREPARIAACALIAPAFHFLEFRSLSKADRKEFQRTGRYHYHNEFVDAEISYELPVEMEKYRLEEMVTHFRTPLLIFHGLRDDIVPCADSLDFTARCAAKDVELHLFKTGDHRLNQQREEMARLACDFFAAKSG